MSKPDDRSQPLLLEPRERDLGGGFFVRRVLPAGQRRAVGPWLFFDHFGPTRLPPGKGMDVRPHPHVNLATVTYLFEGQMLHRDSLGSVQLIKPGDLNWMTAGRGIVHSERTPPEARAAGSTMHGLQLWVGLPREHEEAPPAFRHHEDASLPVVEGDGARVRVMAGEAFGVRSPVEALSRLVYLDVALAAGASVQLGGELGERGVYVIEGDVTVAGRPVAPARMLVLAGGAEARVSSERGARLVVVGGQPFPEPRHIYWNFVSSSEERIEQAKRDWRERRGDPAGPFPLVPGDEDEFIPLPP
jgi:redox-sensitive bicupin YhaK (pirin superfamily)